MMKQQKNLNGIQTARLYMSLIVGWWTQTRNNTKKTAKMSHTVTSREIIVTLSESKKTV